jgi:G:T-mismatch repair DNA endonuclease (very short patch repair protein)
MINLDALQQLRWQVLVIWECEISQSQDLIKKLTDFLTCD